MINPQADFRLHQLHHCCLSAVCIKGLLSHQSHRSSNLDGRLYASSLVWLFAPPSLRPPALPPLPRHATPRLAWPRWLDAKQPTVSRSALISVNLTGL